MRVRETPGSDATAARIGRRLKESGRNGFVEKAAELFRGFLCRLGELSGADRRACAEQVDDDGGSSGALKRERHCRVHAEHGRHRRSSAQGNPHPRIAFSERRRRVAEAG